MVKSADNTQSSLGELLEERSRDFLRLRLEVLRDAALDPVHDLRVASRRLRATIKLYRVLFGTVAGLRPLGRSVRKITREIGLLRNLDEARLFFSNMDEDDLDIFLRRLDEQREQELKTAADLLGRFRLDKFSRRIERLSGVIDSVELGRADLLERLAAHSASLFRVIAELQPLARQPEMVSERHALRIAIKKWRYFIELRARLEGADYHAMLEQLKLRQELLGKLNDLVVFGGLLDEALRGDQARARCKQQLKQQSERLLVRFLELPGLTEI